MSTVKDFQFSIPKFLSSKEKSEIKQFITYLKECVSKIYVVVQKCENNEKEGQGDDQKQLNKEDDINHKENNAEEQKINEYELKQEKQKYDIDQNTLTELLQNLESYYVQ